MIKYMLIPMTLVFSAMSHAACVTDEQELGDTGPSSSKVCESLSAQYPNSDLEVLDRNIVTGENVSIQVSVDGNAQSLSYRLVGADWVLERPQVASIKR